MASMLDRLRAAQPISGQDRRPPEAGEMRIQETRLVLPGAPPQISSETLGYLGAQSCRPVPIEDFLFVDTETTGLRGGAGTVAF